MIKLPDYILKALRDNKTSLGDHPSFPPEEEEKFIVNLVSLVFEEMSENLGETDIGTIKNRLGKIFSYCREIEKDNKQALEKLAVDIVNEMFEIPQNSVQIEANIVNKVDTSKERLIPEKTTDFTFDDIEDMNYLSSEIYKRRMLNALVSGASIYYMVNIIDYIDEIAEINQDLPILYKKCLEYNNFLIFLEKDSLNKEKQSNGGKVDVILGNNDIQPVIEAEGLMFPILLRELIKGILELAVAQGLPKEIKKAKYIMSKADFKLAEMWDERLGYCLWKLIEEEMTQCGHNMMEVGCNFFLMELSLMKSDKFNKTLQEIFAKTTKGKKILSEIAEDILYNKEKDDFDNFIQTKNDSMMQINDDVCFTSDELMDDDEELLTDNEYSDGHEMVNDSLNEEVKKNISESEWNYHFSHGLSHSMKPYLSDNKYAMIGRETGHFGSGTYFSTYKDIPIENTQDNQNPNFIKIGDGVYRVDFDLYKNLYRVNSKKQGDILYTLLTNVNRMFNRITQLGEFQPKNANYNNADLYQVIKSNSEALGLKCPSYYNLTKMAQNHDGIQSFSTLFMEYNGFNGVNVSGIDYYDNTKHGSVIYDLSKMDGTMEQIQPKSLFTGYKDSSYNRTIAKSNIDDYEMNALDGDSFLWDDKLNELPLNRAMRLLKNYALSGKIISPYKMKYEMDNTMLNRYLKILYYSIVKGYPNSHYLKEDIFSDLNIFLKIIKQQKAYYWVNVTNNRDSILIELLLDGEGIDWDLTTEEQNAAKKEHLNMLLKYMSRDLTEWEKDFIEKEYYNTE